MLPDLLSWVEDIGRGYAGCESWQACLQSPPLWLYLAAAIAATTIWRMLGAALIGHINEQSPLFRWVSSIAYGLVAALLMRVLILPSHQLNITAIMANSFTVFIAFLGWWLSRRSIMMGMVCGAISFYFTH